MHCWQRWLLTHTHHLHISYTYGAKAVDLQVDGATGVVEQDEYMRIIRSKSTRSGWLVVFAT